MLEGLHMIFMRRALLLQRIPCIRGVSVAQGCATVLSLMLLGLSGCGSGDEQGMTTSTSPTPVGSTVSLAWDPVPDSSVIGYYIRYGKQSPNHPGSCEYDRATLVSSHQGTVMGLDSGSTYYFAVNAYTDNGAMGGCSNEVQVQT